MKINADLFLDIGSFAEGVAIRRLEKIDPPQSVQMIHLNYSEALLIKNALEQAIDAAIRAGERNKI